MNLHIPNSDVIYDSFGAGFIGQFTRLALQLDLFTPLAGGPASAEAVAQACRTSPPQTRALLDQLTSAHLLIHHPQQDRYELTLSTAAFLVPGAKSYAGDWVLANTDPALWDKMRDTIRSGRSSGYDLPWAQDAWLESYSPSRIEYGLDLWKTVGVEPGPEQDFHILDLASGCGIKSMALAQAHPHVRLTCLDSAKVLIVAQDLAQRLEVESQVSLVAGDLLRDEFGTDQYDAGLLGLITYILTPQQNLEVFQRTCQALKPGAVLVIDSIMTSDAPSEWASRATLLMSTWNGGAAHSFDSYRSWLEQAGFSKVRQHNDHLLSAVK